MFVLFRKRTIPLSLWVELGIMLMFLFGSICKYNGEIHWMLIDVYF